MKRYSKQFVMALLTLLFLVAMLPSNFALAAKAPAMSKKSIQIQVGKTYDLNVTNVAKNVKCNWSTSNKKIATVNSDGLVKGVSEGKATIKCKVTISKKTHQLSTTVTVISSSNTEEAKESIEITANELVNGKLELSGKSYQDIVINNNIGDAQIKLNNVTVAGTLTLENGAEYQVELTNTKIAKMKLSMSMEDKESVAPTLSIGANTTVQSAEIKASYNLKLSDSGSVTSILIAPEEYSLHAIGLTGYQGDLLVNYDSYSNSRVVLSGCKIGKVTIKNAVGDYFVLATDDEKASTIGNIQINAAIMVGVDVQTKQITVDKSLDHASLVIASPVKKLINYGSDLNIDMGEQGVIDEVVDNQGNDKLYGNYYFTKMITQEDYAFTISVGDKLIDGIHFTDYIKLMEDWTDKTKPISSGNVTIETTDITDVYKYTFNGETFYMAVYADKGVIKVYGGNNFKIVNVCVSKKD